MHLITLFSRAGDRVCGRYGVVPVLGRQFVRGCDGYGDPARPKRRRNGVVRVSRFTCLAHATAVSSRPSHVLLHGRHGASIRVFRRSFVRFPHPGNGREPDDIFDFSLALEIGNSAIIAPNRTYAPLTCVPPPPQTPSPPPPP